MTAILAKEKKNAKKSPRTTNNKIYNAEVKERYLNEMVEEGRISEETRKTYARLFKKLFEKESKMKKDLYEYTFAEMEDLLRSFNANNRSTVESYARVLSSYLYWAVENGLSEKNVLAHLKPTDFDSYLVDEEEYFTEETIKMLEEQCENAQDAVILRLLFNGFSGKELSEIRNLKVTDIDKENMLIHLVNTLDVDREGNVIDFMERWESIDEYTLELIEDAIGENIYLKKNGNVNQDDSGHRVPDTAELVDNDYVVRATKNKDVDESKPASRHVPYRRILMLSEHYEMKSKINPKFIQRSGMIYYANQLIKNEELTTNNLRKVAKRFNLRSHHNIKSFLTIENIRKTYPKKND